MKNRFVFTVVALFCVLTSHAQKECVVNVVVENYDKQSLMLDKEIKPNDSGKFDIVLNENVGRIVNLYYITKEQKFFSDRLYVYPGAKINLKFDAKNVNKAMEVRGGNAELNSYLKAYDLLINDNFDDISKFGMDEFLNYIDKLKREIPLTLKKIGKYPDIYEQESVELEIYFNRVIMLYYKTKTRASKDVDARLEKLYGDVIGGNYDNKRYLSSNTFSDFIDDYIDVKFNFDGKDDYFVARYNFVESFFADKDVVKNILFQMMSSSFDVVDPDILKGKMADFYATFDRYHEKELNAMFNSRKRYSKGENIPQLTYSDLDGKPVTLDRYKGKNVVLYFWATWCGPCKREAPYWEKLIKKYANDNIVFITISIDDNLKTLTDYLSKEKKGGIHLHCDCTEDTYRVQTTFGIGGVPYFAIVDTEGRFVRVAAPRPSQDALQTILDQLLSK